jgi:hypothetical protein
MVFARGPGQPNHPSTNAAGYGDSDDGISDLFSLVGEGNRNRRDVDLHRIAVRHRAEIEED